MTGSQEVSGSIPLISTIEKALQSVWLQGFFVLHILKDRFRVGDQNGPYPMLTVMARKMNAMTYQIANRGARYFIHFLNEMPPRRFDWRSFIPVLIIMIGVVFFMLFGTDASSSKGNLIALSEGAIFACMTVSSKRAAGDNPIGLTAIANGFTALVMFLCFPSSSAS